jgi:HKD family nuclease
VNIKVGENEIQTSIILELQSDASELNTSVVDLTTENGLLLEKIRLAEISTKVIKIRFYLPISITSEAPSLLSSGLPPPNDDG